MLVLLLTFAGPCSPFQVSLQTLRGGLLSAQCTTKSQIGGSWSVSGRVITRERTPNPQRFRGVRDSGLKLDMQGEKAVTALLDNLLCQRSVQTQLYYFAEFRDGFKKQWLENFLDHGGLMNFHGFGGLKADARTYLAAMFNSAPVEHEVKMSWGNRLAGGSKDNPFLQDQPKFNSYMETVHPQKICKGLMDIREQIKVEWLTDLPVMKEEDAMFREAYRQLLEEQEASLLKPNSDEMGKVEEAKKSKENDVYKYGDWGWNEKDKYDWLPDVNAEDVPGLEEMARQQRAAEATGGMVQFDNEGEPGAQGYSLLRDDIMVLGIRGDQSSTPLRSKNYDVLKKASTFIAVKRLMTRWARDSKMEGALQWFNLQWHDKYKELLESDSGRHAADRFLSVLAGSPAVAVSAVKADTLQMVTPAQLAMAIIEERQEIVEIFLSWLDTDEIEAGHTALQRELLMRSFSPDAQAKSMPVFKETSKGVEPERDGGEIREDLDSIWKPKKSKDSTEGDACV